MGLSNKYNGTRRVAWIFALSGLFVFILFSLRQDGFMEDVTTATTRLGGPYDRRPFAQTIVHLDLKGAPPLMSVYEWLFPLLRKLGVYGVLMEYEDMFPYSENLAQIKAVDHYSEKDVAKINQLAVDNSLEIIPLVQTFGHMEFILKHSAFIDLRENKTADDTICPTEERSVELIKNVIAQMHALHPHSKRIHIGADEAFHIAEDQRCRTRLSALDKINRKRAVEKLKLSHISNVARLARSVGFKEVLAWNDMFDRSLVEDLRDSGLGDLITPVVWGYKTDVTEEGYLPNGLFDRISQIFPKIYFASAFKGAKSQTEIYIDRERYLLNHQSYVKLYRMNEKTLKRRVGGIILTGWQRYSHHAPLCELLIVSIPSLVTDLIYLDDVGKNRDELRKNVQSLLKCPENLSPISTSTVFDSFTYIPHKDAYLKVCEFQGQELFRLIMEDLHVLEWKVARFRSRNEMRNDLINETEALAKKMNEELLKYYYPKDVNEFLNTKILSLQRTLLQSFPDPF